MLKPDELRDAGVDTVVVAFTDMQGRLMGKRIYVDFFLEELDAGHAFEGCNYLLALEMEMEPVPGYELASWERGYGDFTLQPELGYEAMFGSELEFFLFKESYAEAHASHYRDLTPSVPYILDYHVLATSYGEPLMRQIRNGMQAAGIPVESSK